ncbi:MAG TPA: DUF4440 domain-containing protein [Gemmatimonadales bacterium]|nr:DUF4440 domain-containing protein [Gemmatimonadales bacterium]
MRRAAASSLLIAFAALAGCKAAPAPLTDADKTAAMRSDSAWSAAIAATDMAGMTSRYAPDAMLMAPDMQTFQGTQQIHQFYQGMTSVKVNLQLTQETADGSGDFMYTTGRYHYQQMPSGPSEDGKYLEVWKRGADGKWMLAAQTWSRNAPPAPMPAAPPAKPARRGAK